MTISSFSSSAAPPAASARGNYSQAKQDNATIAKARRVGDLGTAQQAVSKLRKDAPPPPKTPALSASARDRDGTRESGAANTDQSADQGSKIGSLLSVTA